MLIADRCRIVYDSSVASASQEFHEITLPKNSIVIGVVMVRGMSDYDVNIRVVRGHVTTTTNVETFFEFQSNYVTAVGNWYKDNGLLGIPVLLHDGKCTVVFYHAKGSAMSMQLNIWYTTLMDSAVKKYLKRMN